LATLKPTDGIRAAATKISSYSSAGKGGLSTRYPGIKIQFAMKKKIFLSAAILAVAVSAYAQGNGQAGITEATNLITGYFDPGTKLVYAIGAVCGLIGGVKVYNKFSSGDPDTSKTAASWFGACIFLIVAATILRSFFL
jgi:conjugative transposon protein traE family protein